MAEYNGPVIGLLGNTQENFSMRNRPGPPDSYPEALDLYEHRKVLDIGFIAVIDHMGSDHSVATAARVMPGAPWRPDLGDGKNNDEKLIDHMMREKHSTPFEKVAVNFWVKAPIFVYRQWHRHRTWSYNEQSARYQKMEGNFYVPDAELVGKQSDKNHQARVIEELDEHEIARINDTLDRYRSSVSNAYSDYQFLLGEGWPRELARAVLPFCLYSEMEATANLWNLLKFVILRSDEHAQYEIRVYSDAILEMLEELYPISVRSFKNWTWVATKDDIRDIHKDFSIMSKRQALPIWVAGLLEYCHKWPDRVGPTELKALTTAYKDLIGNWYGPKPDMLK